jgi:DNA-binding NarL/FixJ family response regulator
MNDQLRQALLLDHHPLWLDAVEGVLRGVGVAVVAKTSDPESALALLDEHQPDLFVVEPDNPAGPSDEAALLLKRAVETLPEGKVVVLSSQDDPDAIHAALAVGATAYVVKTAHPDDLAATIRQAFSNSVYFATTTAPTLGGAQEVADARLTRRELEILRLVAEGKPNALLARTLWVTEQTVKFHLSNIYRKLKVSNRTEAAHWAQAHGLLVTRNGSGAKLSARRGDVSNREA